MQMACGEMPRAATFLPSSGSLGIASPHRALAMGPQSSVGPTLRSSRIEGPAFIGGAIQGKPSQRGKEQNFSISNAPRDSTVRGTAHQWGN